MIHDNLLETCIEILMIAAMVRKIASEKFFIPLIHMVVIRYFHWMLRERISNVILMILFYNVKDGPIADCKVYILFQSSWYFFLFLKSKFMSYEY